MTEHKNTFRVDQNLVTKADPNDGSLGSTCLQCRQISYAFQWIYMYWERSSTLKLMKKNNYYQHFLNLEKQLLHTTYITNISYIHTMPDQQSTSIQRHDANSMLSNLRLNIVCPHGNYTTQSLLRVISI